MGMGEVLGKHSLLVQRDADHHQRHFFQTMKITKYITVETEVEVDVSTQDIAQHLDYIDCWDDRVAAVLKWLNSIARVFRAIPDAEIVQMTPAQKKLIGEFLKEQAERFAVKEVES